MHDIVFILHKVQLTVSRVIQQTDLNLWQTIKVALLTGNFHYSYYFRTRPSWAESRAPPLCNMCRRP